ncbi:MAG: 7TM-DISM domain-containing protein [Myxococcota bacterium]|nr:7TM-DISM domain-containing protein [Myxococcota bacterium]
MTHATKNGPLRLSGSGLHAWAALLVLLIAGPALADPQRTLRVTAAEEDLNCGFYIDSYEDPDGRLTIDDVSHPDFSDRFESGGQDDFRRGLSSSRFWGRIKLKNESGKNDWFFLIDYPLLDDVQVFLKIDGKVTRVGQSGDQHLFSTRPIGVSHLLFPLRLQASSEATLFFSIQTEGAMLVPARLISSTKVLTWLSHRQTFLGLYFGLVGLLVLYGFVFFFYFRRGHYLVFTGLCGAQLLWLLGESGLLYQYLFPHSPEAMNIVMVIALTCIAYLGFLLDEIFLRRALTKGEKKILLYSKNATLLCVLAGAFLPYGSAVRMAIGLQMYYMLVSFWLALFALIRGYRPARIFFLAICCAVFAGLIILLRSIGVIPLNGLSLHGPMIGVGAFTLMMSLALTDKINLILRERQTLSESFEKFVPKTLVKELIKNGQVARLGGEKRTVTILFSDIRGYSTIIETLDPADVVKLMTSYFDAMQNVIESYGGVVLEFTGDGILAVFGAPTDLPNHPECGLRCAMAMRQSIDRLNQYWRQTQIFQVSKQFGIDRLFNRIGLHSGVVIAGNLGSRETMKYGVVGDTVNVAARLEALNKDLKTDILLSQDTWAELPTDLKEVTATEGLHILKGRKDQIEVYSIDDDIDVSMDGSVIAFAPNQEFEWWNEDDI